MLSTRDIYIDSRIKDNDQLSVYKELWDLEVILFHLYYNLLIM